MVCWGSFSIDMALLTELCRPRILLTRRLPLRNKAINSPSAAASSWEAWLPKSGSLASTHRGDNQQIKC